MMRKIDSELLNNLYNSYDVKHVKALLKAGANPNIRDNEEDTPALIIAINEGSSDNVKALLEDKRTNPNILDNEGTPALILACLNYCLNYHEHFDYECLEIIKALLENKLTNINILDNEGNTVLHVVSSDNHIKVIKLLIEAGANPFIANKDRELAVHMSRNRNITTEYLNAYMKKIIEENRRNATLRKQILSHKPDIMTLQDAAKLRLSTKEMEEARMFFSYV